MLFFRARRPGAYSLFSFSFFFFSRPTLSFKASGRHHPAASSGGMVQGAAGI
jgi:hypothetical protein